MIKNYFKTESKEFLISEIENNEIVINHNLNCWFYEIYYINIYLVKNKKDIDTVSYYSPKYQSFLFNKSDIVSNQDFYNNFVCITPEVNKLIIKRPCVNFDEFVFIESYGKIIKKKYKKIKIVIGVKNEMQIK